MKLGKPSLNHLPYLLVLLIFILRLTPTLNIYRQESPEGFFQAPMGLRLNIDAPGVGTCAGDFPAHFIQQSRCGQYYVSRPGYSAVLFTLSHPIVWISQILPESVMARVPIAPGLLSFAAATGVAIVLNLFLAFGVIIGIDRLFSPYFSQRGWIWLAQVLYASAYGLSIHLSDAVAEVFQQFLMVWIPVVFRDLDGWPRAIILGFAATGKEVLCCFAGGIISSTKEKKLSWHLLFLPIPLLFWFVFLKYGNGVVFQKYYMVSDFDYGRWYLVAFSDFPLFLQRLHRVLGALLNYYIPAFLPVLWIGGIAYPFLSKRIPLLIHAQFLMALGQVLAMGYIHPRILFNFLFMPLLFSTVLLAQIGHAKSGFTENVYIRSIGVAAAMAGLACVLFVFGLV